MPTCCSFLVLYKLLCSHTFPPWGLDILNASNPLPRPTSILALCWTLGIPTCDNQGSYLLLWNKVFFCFSASVAFILVSEHLYLRAGFFFCWQFFESPYSPSSPALCAGVCIMLPCLSWRWMPVPGYKGFLPAAQLCPFPSRLPAAGAAQGKNAHPGRVPHGYHALGAFVSNKMIRALIFALVHVIWKLHAENVPLTQIGLQ